MKNYKLIKNINQENEEILYFDRFTSKKAKEISVTKSYILLSFDNFMNKYIPITYKTNKKQKEYFNNNITEYCYK